MSSAAGRYPSPPASYRALCANWRVRLKDRFVHPHAAAYWPQCLAVERMSRDELLALQRKRFRELIEHVVRHVPFYRRWAEEKGFEVGDEPRLEDLPVTTKSDYRRDSEDFQSDAHDARSMLRAVTSGSTGEPFATRMHISTADSSHCCLWRALARHGLRPGLRRVYVWGQMPRWRQTRWQRLRQKTKSALRDWLNNTYAPNAHELHADAISRVFNRLITFRPVYLHGYPSALFMLARHALDNGPRLDDLALRLVVTDAEKLHDFQREMIARAFGCPVVEHYGSVEFGNIAQCDPGGLMRINEDAYIIESMPSGEAAITGLMGHAYPFIRYRSGDLIVLDEAVGAPLPYASIAEIRGRDIDLFPLPGGGYVHGFVLMHPLARHMEFIRHYQVHQRRVDRLEVRCVLAQPLPAELRAQIQREFRHAVGEHVTVELKEVDRIEPSASGKFRWVISDVSDDRG